MKCPVCDRGDFIRYVFVEECQDGLLLIGDNPGPHFLYMCPNTHIYDEDGNQYPSPESIEYQQQGYEEFSR